MRSSTRNGVSARRVVRFAALAVLFTLAASCGDAGVPPAPGMDGSVSSDLGVDATILDQGAPDLGAPDMTAPCVDADGDGARDAACGGTDCDDGDPARFPGATEVCDVTGRDEDCDPTTYGYRDVDGDGYPDARCCNGAACGDDCNDMRAVANPGASESCDGTSDDDCDGSVDEGCSCTAGAARACGSDVGVCVAGVQTCIAGLWTGCDGVMPGTETCNGFDDDCDGDTDEGLLVEGCYLDRDADGSGVGAPSTQCLDPERIAVGTCPAGYTNSASPADCNDDRADTSPTAVESCDGLDNDCNGVIDDVAGAGDACTVGIGACGNPGVRACSGAALVCVGTAGMPAAERCNGLDDDCNGLADDGLLTAFGCRRDADADGFGTGAVMPQCFEASRVAFGGCPAGWSNNTQLDCNDSNASIRPTAMEVCDGVDDDCDGVADDGVQLTFYRDADSDTWGAGAPVFACAAPADHVARDGDCNDASVMVKPGIAEICDGLVDHNCNGTIDDGCGCTNGATQVCGSTVGLCALGMQTCSGGTWGTCTGTGPRTELCDGLDQDCDGTSDEGATTNFYPDTDGDGVGAGVALAACTAPAGYVASASDCNDAAASVRPGAPELCNGIDDDCDGAIDEACLCDTGATRACGLDVGACSLGTQTCTGGGWGPCSGVTPVVETCNAVDDDCDGFTDDLPPLLSALSVDCGTLAPAFSPAVTGYRVTLPPLTTRCELRAAVACPSASALTVAGVPVGSGVPVSWTFDGFAPKRVPVIVTATDGTTRTYEVVFTRATEYLKASNTDASDTFGSGVALSADGSTLAVGAWQEDSAAAGIDGDASSDAAAGAGAVYVFRRVAGVWMQEAYVKASNTGAGDRFGFSLALSADGSTLAVGAPFEDAASTGVGGDSTSDSALDAGAVYVFRRDAAGWAQSAYVKASNTEAGDNFGRVVALSGDGNTLAVGTPEEDSSATGVGGLQTSNGAISSGAVYVFRNAAGTWSQEAYVKASNTGSNDDFGEGLALSGDGSLLAVGAPLEDSASLGIGGDALNNTATDAGAAYFFRRTGASWVQEAYVKATNTGPSDGFGQAVTMSADGSLVAIGAYTDDSAATGVGGDANDAMATSSGAVFVIRRSAGVWSHMAYLKASNTGVDDWFGRAVSMSSDGAWLAVGASREDSSALGFDGDGANNAAGNAGAVYVFRRDAELWSFDTYVKASNTAFNDYFGTSVAISGDGATLAVSASGEDSSATGVGGNQASNLAADSGAVYVF